MVPSPRQPTDSYRHHMHLNLKVQQTPSTPNKAKEANILNHNRTPPFPALQAPITPTPLRHPWVLILASKAPTQIRKTPK